MKVYYNTHEMYPVYSFTHDQPTWCQEADLPEALVKKYKAAQKKFDKALAEVQSALHED